MERHTITDITGTFRDIAVLDCRHISSLDVDGADSHSAIGDSRICWQCLPKNINGRNPFRFTFTVRGKEVSVERYYESLAQAEADTDFIHSESTWRAAKNIKVSAA